MNSRCLSILLSLFVLAPFPAYTADWYAGLDVMYGRVGISGEKFHLPLMRARAGVWLWENIGIEGMAGVALDNDTQSDLDMDIPSLGAVYARFQSPEQMGIKAYILLGAAAVEMDGNLAASGFPGRETFSGGMASLGLRAPIKRLPNAAWSLEYSNYFVDEDIDVFGWSIGIYYDF